MGLVWRPAGSLLVPREAPEAAWAEMLSAGISRPLPRLGRLGRPG
jgi:hypothetical protein